MRIAIDASHLDPKNLTGTQNYLYNLIHRLSVLDSSNVYDVFFSHEVSKEFFEHMTNMNGNFSFIHLKKSLSWTQCSLALYLMKNKYDVLLAPWQTMPILHRPKMKIVSVIHGLEYKKLQFGPTLYTALFSDRIVAVSQHTKSELMKKYGIKEKKMNVVYEGVDTREFYERTEGEVESIKSKYGIETPYILFIGTAVPRKNLPAMFEAFSRAIKNPQFTQTCFVVGGYVPEEYKDIYDVPAKVGITNNVRFLGKVDQADLPALFTGAEFLAYVSKSEGFGLPVLEALCCGTPVLTSTAGALPEVAGEAALLVDPDSVDAICEGMERLLGDKDLLLQLKQKGVENVKRFSWQNTASSILEVIKEINAAD